MVAYRKGLALGSLGAAVALVAGMARGSGAPPAPSTASAAPAPAAPEPAAALSEVARRAYANACARGTAKFAAHDVAGSVTEYQRAILQAPHEPLAYFLLGEARRSAGDADAAKVAWDRAMTEAGRDPGVRARLLFVLADQKEREKKWAEARVAWQAYLDAVQDGSVPNTFPASARARQRAIDRMTEQDLAYEIVRRRIAETADGGVFSEVAPDSGK